MYTSNINDLNVTLYTNSMVSHPWTHGCPCIPERNLGVSCQAWLQIK
jgi:hypothetical protein